MFAYQGHCSQGENIHLKEVYRCDNMNVYIMFRAAYGGKDRNTFTNKSVSARSKNVMSIFICHY